MRILLITAALLPLAACHASWDHDGAGGGHNAKAAGPVATRSYDLAGFTAVDLRGSDDVEVKVGGAFSVKAEGGQNILDDLDITVVNGTLRVTRKSHDNWSWGDHDGVRVMVTMPAINAASVGGSGDLRVDRAQGDFKGAVGGSGNLTVGTIGGGAVDLAIGGSGDLTVSGTATSLSASVAGSGDIDAKGLSATSAHVSVVGSGSVTGTVKGDADVSIAGSGDVTLVGGAKCKVSSVGSGEARCS
ncbi:MAG: head GIN domain-containing protein [Sphingomonas sp.]